MPRIDYTHCLLILFLNAQSPATLSLKLIQCEPWDIYLDQKMTDWMGETMHVCLLKDFGVNPESQDCLTREPAFDPYVAGMTVDCQCDVFCHHFQDCCANALPLHMHRSQQDEDSKLLILGPPSCISYQLPPWEPTNTLGLFMIDQCPTNSQIPHQSVMRRHCLINVATDELSMFHFVPVEVDGVVYRNIFCAWCHSVQVQKAHLWSITFENSSSECQKIVDRVLEMELVSFSKAYRICLTEKRGFVSPLKTDEDPFNRITSGLHRMGKLCTLRDFESQPSDWTWLNSSVAMETKSQEPVHDHEFEAESDAEADAEADKEADTEADAEADTFLASYLECQKAVNLGVVQYINTFTFGFVKMKYGFTLIRDVAQVCDKCQHALRYYFTTKMSAIDNFLTPKFRTNGFLDGSISMLFHSHEVVSCASLGVCEQEESGEKEKTSSPEILTALTKSGCLLSLASLLAVLFIFKHRGHFCSTEPKRLQFFLILSKSLFFLCLFFSSTYKTIKIVCQIIGIFLHASLLLCFSATTLFGLKVSLLMFRVKTDLARVAIDPAQGKKMGKGEMAQYGLIWGLIGCFGVTVVILEIATEHRFFGYGVDETCFVSGERALFYSVFIPTAITVGINVLTTGISTFLMYRLTMEQGKTIGSVRSVFGYFCRLLAFQSIQWLFGLIYYMTDNMVISYFFTVLSSFEGIFIFLVAYFSRS